MIFPFVFDLFSPFFRNNQDCHLKKKKKKKKKKHSFSTLFASEIFLKTTKVCSEIPQIMKQVKPKQSISFYNSPKYFDGQIIFNLFGITFLPNPSHYQLKFRLIFRFLFNISPKTLVSNVIFAKSKAFDWQFTAWPSTLLNKPDD